MVTLPGADPTRRLDGNTEFARLLYDAGYAERRRAFARMVNARAGDYDTEFDYTHTAVKRWLAGSVPHPPAADAIADTLSDLLGYPVTPADLGWPASGPDERGLVAEVVPVRTLTAVAGLTGRKMNRRDLLRNAAAVGAVGFSDAALLSLTGAYHRAGAAAGAGRQVGAVDVALVRETTMGFSRLDARYGSGELFGDVVGYLHGRTRTALDARYSQRVGRELFAALADLARLAGWMARDQDRPALAQRYYIQALGLAEHAGDQPLAARVLVAMSQQAMQAQEPQRAVALAHAAVSRAAGSCTPALEAAMHGTQASASALAGDERACAGALRLAEAAWERHSGPDEPPWLAYYAATDVASTVARSHRLLGHGEPAERYAYEAFTLCPAERVRHRTTCQVELATSRLVGRGSAVDVDGALQAGHHALDLVEGLHSAHAAAKIRGLQARLQPWQSRVAVRQFSHRADTVLKASA